MSRAYYWGRVLQKVVDSFNVVSFAQHHLVAEWHQFVFHIHPKAGDQLDAIFEQCIKKFWQLYTFRHKIVENGNYRIVV